MMVVEAAGRHAPVRAPAATDTAGARDCAADLEKCMNSGSRLLLAALGGMKECDG
jgi:hypothetical protein